MKLGEIQAEFAFGVLLVTDEGSSEAVPSWGSDDEQVTAATTAAVVRVQHSDEGSVLVRVWDNAANVAGVVAFDGHLQVPSGILKVSDALGSLWLSFAVQAGSCRLRIFVNSAVEADQLDLVIES
jgi:hypothetical protein